MKIHCKSTLVLAALSMAIYAQNAGVSAQTVILGQSSSSAVAPPAPAAQSDTKTPPANPANPAAQNGSAQTPPPSTPPAGPSTCRSVSLGNTGQRAPDFEKQLNNVSGVTVKAVGTSDLVLCGAPKNIDVVENLVLRLTGADIHEIQHDGHVVRLFYHRNASDLATAINNSGGLGTPVKPIGNDLLVFPSESKADDYAIEQYRRWIAQIDVPRAQLSVNAWSVQVSSSDPRAVLEGSTYLTHSVSVFNEKLQSSLQQGWRYLERYRSYASLWGQWQNSSNNASLQTGLDGFFDPEFTDYLQNRFFLVTDPEEKKKLPSRNCSSSTASDDDKPEGEYCLGFTKLFSPIQPSLTSILVGLIATSDSSRASNSLVDCMETRGNCSSEFEVTEAEGIKDQWKVDCPFCDKEKRSNQTDYQGTEPYPASATTSNDDTYRRFKIVESQSYDLITQVKKCIDTFLAEIDQKLPAKAVAAVKTHLQHASNLLEHPTSQM